MAKVIRACFWLLTAWLFAYDLFLWGGLAVTPAIGPRLRAEASVQTPIATTYLYLGRQIVMAAGKAGDAMAFAERRFPEQVRDLESPRQSIVDRFLAAQSAWGTLAYYGAPVLLVLSLVLHLRRQKQIRSFGRKG